jgi:gliding motility-associated-like protein
MRIFLLAAFLLTTATLFSQSLLLSANGDWVEVGDLDVPGNQITLEAYVYKTNEGNPRANIVSKHNDQGDVNYLFRTNSFQMSTTTGFYFLDVPYTYALNQWYHIAVTYDGAALKYYVNGCKFAEMAATGDLIQNDRLTAIGNRSLFVDEQFIGYLDEISIWNKARTETQIRADIDGIPTPTTQANLKLYLQFSNNYLNAQGNPLFNGNPMGLPQFSATNLPKKVVPKNYQVTHTDNACFAQAAGTITVSGAMPLASAISPPAFSPLNKFNGLLAGAYQVIIKPLEWCFYDTVSVNITAPKLIQSTINQQICEGQNFFGYTSTGTYTDTLIAKNGCDSVRVINLTVLPRVRSLVSASICEGRSFLGHTVSGVYIDTLRAKNGCDSIRAINLKVLPRKTGQISASICEGQSFLGHAVSGVYIDTLVAKNGCDSIRTIILKVLPRKNAQISATICEGQSYLGRSVSGTYVDVLVAKNGCDSIRTLLLTVLKRKNSQINATICEGEFYLGRSVSGTYVDVLVAKNGCDSVRTLLLKVLPVARQKVDISICAGETYAGYQTAGLYIDTFAAKNGCDSIRTLQLAVRPLSAEKIDKTICQGQSFLGRNTSGTYVDKLIARNGCDSIRTLSLKVGKTYFTPWSGLLCPQSAYDFLGKKLRAPGIYFDTLATALGCDSVFRLELKAVPPITGFLGRDTILCEHKDYVLRSKINATEWYDNTEGLTKAVDHSGIFWAAFVDQSGCYQTDSVSIEFPSKFYTPNAFSPNNDGVNDLFAPILLEKEIKNYVLQVFDRWGSLIFNSSDPANQWNGLYHDSPCESGVYIWVVSFSTSTCPRIVDKGSVQLFR